jgi:YidC/Oxa1 family membrane protein insertase
MDIQRLILFLVFSFSLLFLWEAWQKEQTAHQQAVVAKAGQSAIPSSASASPPAAATTAPVVPAKAGAASVPVESVAALPVDTIKVQTDLVKAEISTRGGDIVYLELLKHRDSIDETKNLILLGPEHKYFAQSGLTGEGYPNHKTVFKSSGKDFQLKDAENSVSVRLEAAGTGAAAGVTVVKIITFKRNSYLVDISQEIQNGSGQPVTTGAYFQLSRNSKAPAGDGKMVSTYTGPALFSEQDKFHKIDFSDIDKSKVSYTANTNNGWIAMLQHYFVSAILLPDQQQREYFSRKIADDLYTVGAIVPLAAIPAGGSSAIKASLYSGPEEQDKLKSVANGLELSVDYGWLTVIAAPLFWVLQYFHTWTGNWGLAIIFLTVVIKLIFFPLSAASYRSMAKMKLVTPKMMKIREQYANDRMKQNQAMMDLYKQEKINPLGGCLPIVVQIPVFISLYWVLLASVELRHAPFYGWITDLASVDPYYILPALMMASMVVQTRLNPTPPDPVQAKVMQIMPIAFGVMFFFFPAGLVLYWLVNNILSIAQQWQITRMIEGNKAQVGGKS